MIIYLCGSVAYYFVKTAMVGKLRPYVRGEAAMIASALIWPISAVFDVVFYRKIKDFTDNIL